MAKKILIIDENENFVAITKSSINNGRYDIETSLGVQESDEKIDENSEVTLLDILMPRQDGYKSSTDVLSGEHSCCAPVVLLTGAGANPGTGKTRGESVIPPEKFEALMMSLGDLSDIFSATIRKQIIESAKNEHISLQEDTPGKQANNTRLLDLHNDIAASADFEKFSHTRTLDDGSVLIFRPIKSADDVLLKDLFMAMSEDSIAFTKLQSIKAFPHLAIEELVKTGCFKGVAIGAFLQGKNTEKIIGIACYTLSNAVNCGEISFIVHNDWHGKGVSSYLLNVITEIAKKRCVASFNAVIHKNRTQVFPLFYNSGYNVTIKRECNVYTISYPIENRLAVRRYMNDNKKICYQVGIR